MSAVHDVPIGMLRPNPQNPRTDLGDLDDLVESIQEHGILQPLLATRTPRGTLVLLTGHRRLAAARRAGWGTVPVLFVGPRLEDQQLVVALAENLHRAQLTPMDEARACRALLDYGRSRKDVAVELSRSGNWVADRLALLELPPDMQRAVDNGDMPISKAAQLGYRVRRNRTGSIVVGAKSPYHFTRTHPLASSARGCCDDAEHPANGRFGAACGACWEAAIRADERAHLSATPTTTRETA